MFAKLRPRSAYDVMAALSLLLVLTGGVAYAANTIGSSDIIDGQVREADIGQGAVATAELKNDAVTSPKVKDNALKGVDIDESTLSSIGGGGPAGGDLTGSYPNPQIGPSAVGSAEVSNESLTGDDVVESSLEPVRSALQGGTGVWASNGACDPVNGQDLVTCATRTITLDTRGSILVIGRVRAYNNNAGEAAGRCYIVVGGFVYPDSVTEISLKDIYTEHAEVMAVTPPHEPDEYIVQVMCSEFLGNFSVLEGELVAVALSAG